MRICGTSQCFVCHIWLCMICRKLFPLQWKLRIVRFLVFENFYVTPVWFLGNHIWSLNDYQEFIQIIYELVWLLRIVYDVIRNQRKMNDWSSGFIQPNAFLLLQSCFLIIRKRERERDIHLAKKWKIGKTKKRLAKIKNHWLIRQHSAAFLYHIASIKVTKFFNIYANLDFESFLIFTPFLSIIVTSLSCSRKNSLESCSLPLNFWSR